MAPPSPPPSTFLFWTVFPSHISKKDHQTNRKVNRDVSRATNKSIYVQYPTSPLGENWFRGCLNNMTAFASFFPGLQSGEPGSATGFYNFLPTPQNAQQEARSGEREERRSEEEEKRDKVGPIRRRTKTRKIKRGLLERWQTKPNTIKQNGPD